MIHDGEVKIADFGISKNLESKPTTRSTVFGVLPYVDSMKIENSKYEHNKKSDIYSVGVLLWEISSGKPPFHSSNDDLLLALRIGQGERETPLIGTPIEYVRLYQRCWSPTPDERPSIEELRELLVGLPLEPIFEGLQEAEISPLFPTHGNRPISPVFPLFIYSNIDHFNR